MSKENSRSENKTGVVNLETRDAVSDAMDRADEQALDQCCCCTIATTFLYWTGCLCCCCDKDNMKDHGLDHIVKERICTDVPWCLAFIITLAVQAGLLFVAVSDYSADPRWLVYYADWEGNLCAPGSSAGSRAAWPDIRIYDVVICVDSCNDTQTDPRVVTPDFSLDFDNIDLENGSLSIDVTGYETESYFQAYCLPTLSTIEDIVDTSLSEEYQDFLDEWYDTIDNLSETLSLAMDDIYTMRYIYIICAINAFIVSLCWGYFIRHCGGVIVWCSILFTLFGVIVISYYMISFSDTAYAFGYTTIGDIMYYGGIALGIADGMFFLAICFMWHRIRLAIALAKETTRALNSMWGLFFYPAVPAILFVGYTVYWIVGALFMASVTVTVKKDMPSAAYDEDQAWYDGAETLCEALNCDSDYQYKEFSIDETWQYILLFHFFVYLWVAQFIVYHTYLVLAGVYAEWYFAEWKDYPKDTVKARGNGRRQLSRTPIWDSFWRTTLNHMGTLAIGSLLIAIIEFIEYTLTYFEKKFRNGEPSPLQTALICLIKCLLKCLKCILDRINRNGYIICAITGWPFCASSMKGLKVVFSNIIRSAALEMVSGYLEKLGKIAIVSYNTAVIMMIAYYAYRSAISSLFLPTILCLVISYTVCYQYMQLYEVGLETIFICFLIDEEINKAKQFKDENGNILIHPETGKPIGKMRASHRLYKLIGLKKPKIRASRRNVKLLQETQRARDEMDGNNSTDKKASGKSFRKMVMFDDDSEVSESESQSHTSSRRDSRGKKNELPNVIEMEDRLRSTTGSKTDG